MRDAQDVEWSILKTHREVYQLDNCFLCGLWCSAMVTTLSLTTIIILQYFHTTTFLPLSLHQWWELTIMLASYVFAVSSK